MTTLVVQQPSYLSWLGYLSLLDQADVFVLLDTVQFERCSFQQRNRIKTAAGVQWLTVPVVQRFGQLIREVQVLNDGGRWQRKHYESLRHAYRKAPGWAEAEADLQELYEVDWQVLYTSGPLRTVNFELLRWLALRCGVRLAKPPGAGADSKLVWASDLGVTGGRGDLLVNLCRRVGADTYLSTPGSAAYLASQNPFPAAGIELQYLHYEHPTYPQLHGPFVSHLSALDLLLNVGSARAGEVLRSGQRPPLGAEEVHARVQAVG